MVLLPYIIFSTFYWIYKSTKEDGDFIERVSRAFSNSSVLEKILFGAGIGIFGFFIGIYFIFLMLKGVIQFFVEIPEQRQIRKENRLREIEKNERWWEEYNEYLKSDDWQRKRHVVLKRDNWKCVRCGDKAVQVHHMKYSRKMGREPIDWLESICISCHEKEHSDKKDSKV